MAHQGDIPNEHKGVNKPKKDKHSADNSNGEEFSGDDSGCEDDSSDEESHPPDKESQDESGDNHVETASHENDFSVKTQRVATRTTGLSHQPLHSEPSSTPHNRTSSPSAQL